MDSAVGLADVLEDGEGLDGVAVAEDEVAGAGLGQLGGVLSLRPAADIILEAGRTLDRHDGGDVGLGCELGAHRFRIAGNGLENGRPFTKSRLPVARWGR